MTTIDIDAALTAAREEEQALKEKLGASILKEEDTTAIEKQLTKASATVKDLERRMAAVEAAKAKALAAEEERIERERKAEIDRLLKSAREGHARLVDLAREVDKHFDAFVEATIELENASRSYVDDHRPLNLNRNATGVLMMSGWVAQILNNLRNFGSRGMRNWWANNRVSPVGSGNRVQVADIIPTLPALFGGKGEAI